METLRQAYVHIFHCRRFKSYYVVWKHKNNKMALPFFLSLNRTMQYGNRFEAEKKEKYKKQFKSYYVVWKR